jgi:hypothetical protein
MGKMTLGDKLMEKRRTFEEASFDMTYTKEQHVIFQNAIDSVNYVMAVYAGTVSLPALTEDSESDWSKVNEWLAGSYRNIEIAEDLINGKSYESEEIKKLKARIAVLEAEKKERDNVISSTLKQINNIIYRK